VVRIWRLAPAVHGEGKVPPGGRHCEDEAPSKEREWADADGRVGTAGPARGATVRQLGRPYPLTRDMSILCICTGSPYVGALTTQPLPS
jgi:hypothetical protein